MTADLPLLKPDLYASTCGGVSLTGGRCSACGFTFFPMQARGCERCGAHGASLGQADLGSVGTLISAATVHLHAGKGRTAPFVVGVIQLDSGPRVRTLLEGMPDAENANGRRVTAMLCEGQDRDGKPALDIRFRPAG